MPTYSRIGVGGNCGMRDICVLDANTRIIAVDTGGFWRTTDDGLSWAEANKIGLAGDPNDTAKVTSAATGEDRCLWPSRDDPTNKVFAVKKRGPLKSTDKGASWVLMFDAGIGPETEWGGFDHGNSDVTKYMVGRSDSTAGANVEVRVSKDSGTTWTTLTFGSANAAVKAVCVHPTDDNTWYIGTDAGLWKLVINWAGTPSITSSASFENGLPASNNKRTYWMGFNYKAATPAQHLWITFTPVSPTTYDAGVYKTDVTEGTPTWSKKMNGLPETAAGSGAENCSWYTNLTFKDASTYFLGTRVNFGVTGTWGVWRTTDSGSSWTRVTDTTTNIDQTNCLIWADGNKQEGTNRGERFRALAVSVDGNTLYAAGKAEIFKNTSALTGNPITWKSEYSDPGTGVPTSLYKKGRKGPQGSQEPKIMIGDSGNTIIIGTNDRLGQISKDAGVQFRRMNKSGLASDALSWAVQDPNTALTWWGVTGTRGSSTSQVIKSTDGGESWNVAAGWTSTDDLYHMTGWNVAGQTNLLIAGSVRPWYTTNSGSTWVNVTTGNWPFTAPAAYEVRQVYRASDGTMFAAVRNDSDNGGIVRATSVTGAWTDITTGSDGLSVRRRNCVGVFGDPTNPDELFIACKGNTAANGGVWRSTNARAGTPDWTKIYGDVNGTPPNDAISAYWTTVSADASQRVYVTTFRDTQAAHPQFGNGVWFSDTAPYTTWTRIATRDDGFHHQNAIGVYINPFDNDKHYLGFYYTGSGAGEFSFDILGAATMSGFGTTAAVGKCDFAGKAVVVGQGTMASTGTVTNPAVPNSKGAVQIFLRVRGDGIRLPRRRR